MDTDLSPGSVLLFHLLGGMSWGAGQLLGRGQTASATVIYCTSTSLWLQLTCKQWLSWFQKSLKILCPHFAQKIALLCIFSEIIHNLSPSLISFSDCLKNIFFCFSYELKYINSLVALTLPYIMHLQWRTLYLANTKIICFFYFSAWVSIRRSDWVGFIGDGKCTWWNGKFFFLFWVLNSPRKTKKHVEKIIYAHMCVCVCVGVCVYS